MESRWDRQGRIQHKFLQDREGWIRCRLAETDAGSDPTATPSQRDLVLPKNNHRRHPMPSCFPSTDGATQVRRSEGPCLYVKDLDQGQRLRFEVD